MTSHRNPSRVVCCFITSLLFVIIVPTLWISLVLRLPPDMTSGVSKTMTSSMEDADPSNRTIFFFAKVVSADIIHGTMVVEWSFAGDTCSSAIYLNSCTTVNIFFDMDLSPSDPRHNNGPYSNNITTDPILIRSGIRPFTFRTELVISTNDVSYLSAYPFDTYYIEMFAFAQDVSTNESVILKLAESFGLITGIKTTTRITEVTSDYPTGSIGISVILQRSSLVIAYCLIITFTFWMVTLMICLIMIATVFFGFRQQNEIVVVPIGTVFAFTQLRASMPGAPEGFGDILDFVGLLPCLVLLSISAITMVGVYLFTNPDDPARKAFTGRELKNDLCHCFQHVGKTAQEWVRRAQFRIMIARQIQQAPYNFEIPLMNTAHANVT